MALCPDCAREFYLADEDNLEIGDIVNCAECGVALEVVRVGDLEFVVVKDADEESDEEFAEEEEGEGEGEEEELELDEVYADDFDDNGFYGSDED